METSLENQLELVLQGHLEWFLKTRKGESGLNQSCSVEALALLMEDMSQNVLQKKVCCVFFSIFIPFVQHLPVRKCTAWQSENPARIWPETDYQSNNSARQDETCLMRTRHLYCWFIGENMAEQAFQSKTN